MASAYFLNCQTPSVTLGVNGGLPAPINGFQDQNDYPVALVGLALAKDGNVLGTSATNTVEINSMTSDGRKWQVQMGSGINSTQDMQFLVFENRLIGRQGSNLSGFVITDITN